MSRGNYLKDRRRILAEGFRLSEFLTLCIREDVRLRKVRQKSEIAMTFEVTEEDWPKLRRLAGNRWRLTVLERRGAVPLFYRLLSRKSIFAGLA
ncbi:MAG: sporulation protein YqfD, partial [Firmicutes bacterium]|nr:sporulation protein YqfD [Bacillota bacterium]